jgi:glycosyltransferase involved in cell wall biosynthesis
VTVPRRLRVLWLIKGLGPGGAERLLVEHAERGDHDRFAYEAAHVLDWKDHLVPQLTARGLTVHTLGVRSFVDPRWIVRLHALLRSGDYDVVHAHSPQVAAVARGVVRAMTPTRRPAFVYTEHNRWPSYQAVTRFANRVTYRWNDAVLAVSRDVRESMPPRYRTNVEVVVHGIDVERVRSFRDQRAPTRAELGIGDDDVLAVTVANLRAGKNYPGLLAAARLVVDRGLPVWFVAAGQGQLEAEIRTLHAESHLGERFQLLGYRDDSTRLIAAADMFLLASHHEGLPVTVMEALTLGVPVVAPRVGGLPEVVDSERDGILVTPGSPIALADAIERVADTETRARLIAGARAIGDRFSSTQAIARMESTYAAVASPP